MGCIVIKKITFVYAFDLKIKVVKLMDNIYESHGKLLHIVNSKCTRRCMLLSLTCWNLFGGIRDMRSNTIHKIEWDFSFHWGYVLKKKIVNKNKYLHAHIEKVLDTLNTHHQNYKTSYTKQLSLNLKTKINKVCECDNTLWAYI